jgi:ABC-2 type transport system ATP-binding protein
VQEVLALTGLADAAERRAGGFSLGMRQRLGLAAALIGDPAVLILDEPANGLDPDGVRWLRELLRRLAGEGRTVLVSSHLLAEAAQTVDEVIILNRRRLIAHAPLGELTSMAGPVIRVRTSRAEELRSALAADGADTRIAEPGWVEVTGATPEQVGTRAASLVIPVYESTAEAPSLEAALFPPDHGRPGPGGLAMTTLVRVELEKLRTTGLPWALLAASTALTLALVLLRAARSSGGNASARLATGRCPPRTA